jgi:type IV secretory pathway VirJ component
MSAGTRLLLGLASCAGLMMSACMLTPHQSVSPAFFMAAPQDSDTVQAFAREQERQVQTCAAAHACDRAHYLRALAALYEDRQVAMMHFQAAAKTPNGRYAASSLQWILLLENGKGGALDQAALSQAVERLVRDVIEYEIAIASQSAEARQRDAQAIQSLKQELKVREKRIDELTQQIDALKRVDQEVKDRVKPSRPGN